MPWRITYDNTKIAVAHQSVMVNLQRRIGEWRRTMARRLVFGGVEERNDVEPIAAVALSLEVALRLATLVSATPTPDGKEPHD